MVFRRTLWMIAIAAGTACASDDVDPVCAEIGLACHEAAAEQGEGSLALECHELEEDTTKTAEECEAMRADCEAACGDTGS